MTDELRVRRQTKCAEKGHKFDRGSYGICVNCQLQVVQPARKVRPKKGKRRG